MHWIRTRDGSLCNLALATDVAVAPPAKEREGLYQLRAAFSGCAAGDYTVLSEHPTSEAAQRAVDELYAALKRTAVAEARGNAG